MLFVAIGVLFCLFVSFAHGFLFVCLLFVGALCGVWFFGCWVWLFVWLVVSFLFGWLVCLVGCLGVLCLVVWLFRLGCSVIC